MLIAPEELQNWGILLYMLNCFLKRKVTHLAKQFACVSLCVFGFLGFFSPLAAK